MKKTLIIISVLLISAFTVFAEAESSAMTLNATVEQDTTYTFILSFNEVAVTGQTESGWNAAVANTAYFKINSTESVNFENAAQDIVIDVTVDPWIGSTNGQENAISLQNFVDATGDAVGVTPNTTEKTFTVNFKAGYTAPELLGTFEVNWDNNPTLAADTYSSTVTIGYTQI